MVPDINIILSHEGQKWLTQLQVVNSFRFDFRESRGHSLAVLGEIKTECEVFSEQQDCLIKSCSADIKSVAGVLVLILPKSHGIPGLMRPGLLGKKQLHLFVRPVQRSPCCQKGQEQQE